MLWINFESVEIHGAICNRIGNIFVFLIRTASKIVDAFNLPLKQRIGKQS